MKTYLDCFPCFMRQALFAARISTNDVRLQREVLNRVAEELTRFPLDATPVEMGEKIHAIVKEITGNKDPYKEEKRKYNEIAMNMLPRLREIVSKSSDRLLSAIRIAIAGNIIDFGSLTDFNIEDSLEHALSVDFAIFDYDEFRSLLNTAHEVMYIGDNAGEICFDRVLVEELNRMGKKVYFITREEPVINDITLEDARFCKLHEIAEVMSSGSTAPGTIIKHTKKEFRDLFNSVPMIIAKGQGNYETLSGEKRPIFFLLKVKCPVVARDIGANNMDIVLKYNLK